MPVEGRASLQSAEADSGWRQDAYMTQEGLYLAKDGFRHLDGTRPALGLTQLTQGGQVVHGMCKRLIVSVHKAQAL